jgi:hypothetical protein
VASSFCCVAQTPPYLRLWMICAINMTRRGDDNFKRCDIYPAELSRSSSKSSSQLIYVCGCSAGTIIIITTIMTDNELNLMP